MIAVLRLVFSILPTPVQLFILGLIGLVLFLLIFKFIAFVLKSIPFL